MEKREKNGDIGRSFLTVNSQYLLPNEVEDDGLDDDGDCDRTCVLREQDRFLPIANVSRLIKKAIPPSGKIAKDARECVQECVSEFVSFVTSEASDRCRQEKRKTINGEDILMAMSSLGFDNYIEPLKVYLQKYRESIHGKVEIVSGDDETVTVTVDEVNRSLTTISTILPTASSTKVFWSK